jgi:hypothetical protein
MSDFVIVPDFRVDYTVFFQDENRPTLAGSLDFRAHSPNREDILQAIRERHADTDWPVTKNVTYTVYEVMNNNARLTRETGEATTLDLLTTPGQAQDSVQPEA